MVVITAGMALTLKTGPAQVAPPLVVVLGVFAGIDLVASGKADV